MVKYYVSDDVEHGCCYRACVKFGNKETDENSKHICECRDEDNAQMISDALNRKD